MKLSVVLAIYNEAQSIPELMHRLKPVCRRYEPFEIICVDDASKDQTVEALLGQKQKCPQIKIIKFATNCGKSDCLAAGIREAKGEIIATLDADLQDPPEEIPKLMEALDGVDAVIGWRHKRADNPGKQLASRFANWFRNLFIKDGIHDTGCPLQVYRREAIAKVDFFRGGHRFIPALLKMNGFNYREIKVANEYRRYGKSKSKTFLRAFPALYDLIGVVWIRRRALKYKIDKII